MNDLIAYMTLVAGVVTIMWFIRDVRKQNSKVLKAILDVQKTQLEVIMSQATILEKIDAGQRKGFQLLSENLTAIQKSIVMMQEGIQKSIVTMQEGIQKSIVTMQEGIQKSIAIMQEGIQKELRYIAELLAFKKT